MSAVLQTISSAVHSVPAGFPAAANESSHEQVSLDSYLVSNPTSTVLFRVRGESMTGAGIFDGDLLVVDRSSVQKALELKLTDENRAFAYIVLQHGLPTNS